MPSGCAERRGGIGWPVAALICVAASACRDRAGEERAGAPPAAEPRAVLPRAAVPEPPPDADLAALPEIAFVSESDGRAEIHAVRPDGSGRRVVAASPDASVYPAAGAGPAWLLTIRAGGGEAAHREQLGALDHEGRATALMTAGRIRNPSASPDGWVAVESDRESFRDIYRVPLAGGPARRLTSSRHGNFEPAVSPDGSRIAFTSSRDGNAEIYAMRADGGRETRLTAFHRDDWSPVWSPAGDALAFLSDREGPARVFLMRPDGTQLRRLLGDWDAEVEEEAPVFSPDGSQLALVARRADGGGEVWVADARSGRRWPLSRDGARDSTPAWSPDGRYLVFASQTDGQSDLYVARAAGGQSPRRLTRDPAQEWLPRWTAPALRPAISRRR
jgi:WD40 repeat protein